MMDTTGAPRKVAIITGRGGLRFTAEIRGHEVPTDQPGRAGGDDSAAMPLELLAASLGTCAALYAHQFCAARDIEAAGLTVEVRYDMAKAPARIGRFDVVVLLPDSFPEQYRAAIERAVKACPVHNTFTHAPEVSVALETAAAVESAMPAVPGAGGAVVPSLV